MVRFGEVEVDVPGRELIRGGQAIHLEPQAFDLLVALLEHRDRVLSKIELLNGVWGHRFVSEANLTTRSKEIRRAVGDDGSQQHPIKNVRGRGYRFVAEVEAQGPLAMKRSGMPRLQASSRIHPVASSPEYRERLRVQCRVVVRPFSALSDGGSACTRCDLRFRDP